MKQRSVWLVLGLLITCGGCTGDGYLGQQPQSEVPAPDANSPADTTTAPDAGRPDTQSTPDADVTHVDVTSPADVTAPADVSAPPQDASPGIENVSAPIEDATPPPGGEDSGSGAGDTTPQPAPTVAFVAPANNATLPNPVTFRVRASDVHRVQIKADDWPLSEPWDPRQRDTLTYTFSGTGTPRRVVLYGYDTSGAEVARDQITITIQAPARPPRGTAIGTYYNTYYYIEDESDFTGSATDTFYDRSCNVLAKVRPSFARLACIEGTARLKDGRTINYDTGTRCGGPCNFTWSVMSSQFAWGKGSRGNALEPLRSWAVDNRLIPHGTVLYVEEWDGLAIPSRGSLGGYTHDGCFRADDVGGAITDQHVDIYTGLKSMRSALEAIFPTRTRFVIYKNSPRCAHL